MARRRWARSIVVAMVAGAGAAAVQLGLGYGLSVIAWTSPTGSLPTGSLPTGSQPSGAWSASVAWAVWIAATSVVVGALVGTRVRVDLTGGRFVQAMCRFAIAVAAALGALITVPLVAVPARVAHLNNGYAPHLLAGTYAAVGVAVGLALATSALASRAVAANILASTVWLWGLAVIAVIDGVAAGKGFGQLSVWKFTDSGPVWHSFYLPGSLLTLGAALLIGGLAAFPAAIRGDGRVGVAISGAMGPMLVAVAYILAEPVLGQAPTEQLSAAITAPYAVIAGLIGSVLVAAVGSVPTRTVTPRPLARDQSVIVGRSTPAAVGPAPIVSPPTQASAPAIREVQAVQAVRATQLAQPGRPAQLAPRALGAPPAEKSSLLGLLDFTPPR